MLRPPFEGGNPLVVARTIVEGTYAPLDAGYSELLSRVVTRLLCVQPEQRPDIDEVAQMISPLLVTEVRRPPARTGGSSTPTLAPVLTRPSGRLRPRRDSSSACARRSTRCAPR